MRTLRSWKRLSQILSYYFTLLACLSCALSLDPQIFLSGSLDTNNSTAPYVFNSLAGLLTQWPNTYHPNGHTIIPGVLEPFTLLYHARKDPIGVPPSPEWFAFDPEMSYGIMAVMGGQTFMFTYQSVRPAKVIYFDGMSAALRLKSGWLDSQEVLLRGKGKSGGEDYIPWDEYGRAESLCDWGAPYGVEGYIRMNTGFELMWCNFSSPSLQLVSHLNITPPGTPPGAPIIEYPPPGRDILETSDRLPWMFSTSPLSSVAWSDWLRAAGRHNSIPQPQIRLDYSAFISFYDPRLRSLARAREGQAMRQHRIWPNISDSDAESVVRELRSVLQRSRTEIHGTELNWRSMAITLVERWGGRIVQLHDFLDNSTSALKAGRSLNLTETLLAVRRQSYSPLNLYIDTTTVLPSRDLLSGRYPDVSHASYWNASSLRRCAFSATWFLHGDYIRHHTSQERLLQTSIEAVLLRLCSDYGVIFTESMNTEHQPERNTLMEALDRWQARVVSLMEWLDWTDWLRCEEVCPSNSACTMTLWPVLTFRVPGAPEEDDSSAAWKPRCEKLDQDRRPPGYEDHDIFDVAHNEAVCGHEWSRRGLYEGTQPHLGIADFEAPYHELRHGHARAVATSDIICWIGC
ncbi:hypothetical protein OBBRIDRAFT_251161 [Obba rivulosa]|uniref:Uncharacterized protein n=1 Tax=Obba rivulosa TaxID=1052685 RepID=A0A8E2DGS3_9APHY|nr:hypothetical protein OBBRIDRAFT_251161 [Obba rivulosa]